jgi:hypothetical protein
MSMKAKGGKEKKKEPPKWNVTENGDFIRKQCVI